MQTLTLVTGNPGKLAEWRRLIPATYHLETVDLDLDEIQSLDLEKIVTDKVKRAFEAVGKPVIVEDLSAGLDKLGGLPGPFMKFFEQQLGGGALYKLADAEGDPVTVRCAIAYYDGMELLIVQSEIKGSVVPMRGKHGFGFDKVFVPAGHTKTYGEMTASEKDAMSHRAQAINLFVKKLKHQV